MTGQRHPGEVAPRRPGDPAVLVASSDRIQAELGWKPERDLRAMVADAWAFARRCAGDRHGRPVTAERWFGATGSAARPEGVWLAPGRVNLIGEHTDYNDGFVLPFALEPGRDGGRRAGAATACSRCGPGRPRRRGRRGAGRRCAPGVGRPGWAAYPAGVAWALREAGHPVGGAGLAVDSDLPQGAGLSSSAALECAVALALAELYGLDVPRPELAALAQRAENDFVGVPVRDHGPVRVLLCRAGHALLLDCRTGVTAEVPLDPAAAGLALLVIDTRAPARPGRRRVRASGAATASEAAALLGVRVAARRHRTSPSAWPAGRPGAAPPGPARGHRERAGRSGRRRCCAAGAVAEVGPLLNASHASLRDDFEVSWPEADAAVDAAMAAGALGARMIGGGFGGSVIALVPADRADRVRDAITTAYEDHGWPHPSFLEATPSQGAHRLT